MEKYNLYGVYYDEYQSFKKELEGLEREVDRIEEIYRLINTSRQEREEINRRRTEGYEDKKDRSRR
ncbi:hypothetical protein [Romboutsia timonensis]|uniref:hypothetical protein n=1 Tax=Romboutsia timonensis TaxID=1776391 RepID=UPI0023F78BAD|nr:hypothetical protein [Romboutsia timonensis]